MQADNQRKGRQGYDTIVGSCVILLCIKPTRETGTYHIAIFMFVRSGEVHLAMYHRCRFSILIACLTHIPANVDISVGQRSMLGYHMRGSSHTATSSEKLSGYLFLCCHCAPRLFVLVHPLSIIYRRGAVLFLISPSTSALLPLAVGRRWRRPSSVIT